ncbi:hypothetical protein M513_12519 [Trichuris suis]|uniref:Uncharacterized protein n=1 Tax=Trichuris suis TaxID=68888 RepID=A0A085LNN9_9BILA|nr:hypothetical protein M513_12519 [Trichuris suis]
MDVMKLLTLQRAVLLLFLEKHKIDKYGHRVILFYEFNPSHRAVASAQHTCAAQSSLIGEQMSPVPV